VAGVKGRVGTVGRRVMGGLAIASVLATALIFATAPLGYRLVAACGAAMVVLAVIGLNLLWPDPPDPILRDYKTAVAALEEVAHFAPGRAGVVAARALVELGVWIDTVDLSEQPLPLTWAIRRLAESPPFKLPVHDGPIGPYLAESVLDGTWTFVVPVRVEDEPEPIVLGREP
jgi:hypothetical protein